MGGTTQSGLSGLAFAAPGDFLAGLAFGAALALFLDDALAVLFFLRSAPVSGRFLLRLDAGRFGSAFDAFVFDLVLLADVLVLAGSVAGLREVRRFAAEGASSPALIRLAGVSGSGLASPPGVGVEPVRARSRAGGLAAGVGSPLRALVGPDLALGEEGFVTSACAAALGVWGAVPR